MSRTALLMTRVNRSFLYRLIFIMPFQGDYHGQDVPPPNDYNKPHPDQTVEVPNEEQKKKWWDLDGDRKKQLEVRISLVMNSYLVTDGPPDRRWPFGRCRRARRWLRRVARAREQKKNRRGCEQPTSFFFRLSFTYRR